MLFHVTHFIKKTLKIVSNFQKRGSEKISNDTEISIDSNLNFSIFTQFNFRNFLRKRTPNMYAITFTYIQYEFPKNGLKISNVSYEI